MLYTPGISAVLVYKPTAMQIIFNVMPVSPVTAKAASPGREKTVQVSSLFPASHEDMMLWDACGQALNGFPTLESPY